MHPDIRSITVFILPIELCPCTGPCTLQRQLLQDIAVHKVFINQFSLRPSELM